MGSQTGDGKKGRKETTGSGDGRGLQGNSQRASEPEPKPEPSAKSDGDDIADLERSMAALKFVPPSVTRGQLG